jgi:hypothetical protein
VVIASARLAVQKIADDQRILLVTLARSNMEMHDLSDGAAVDFLTGWTLQVIYHDLQCPSGQEVYRCAIR